MANYISTLEIDGVVYQLSDTEARAAIAAIQASLTGGFHLVGEVIDPDSIKDLGNQVAYVKTGTNTCKAYYTGTAPSGTTYSFGGTTYTIDEKVALKSGDLVIAGTKEFLFYDSDSKWHEFGSTGSLKALAFKDSASGRFKPKGSVSSTFTGTPQTKSHSVTNAGSVSASGSYTPEGTIAQGEVTNDTVIKSYPGASSKMVLTEVHDTPTAKKAALATKQYLTGATPVKQKLEKTTITGVSGATKATKANAASVNGLKAQVSGETLKLTSALVTFTDVSVPIAATAKSVATGAISASGTGSEVVTGVTEAKAAGVSGLADGATEVAVDVIAGDPVQVATGQLAAGGTGSAVMTGLGTPTSVSVVKSVANPIFTGKAKAVNVTGTNSGIVIADHEITPAGSVSSTFNGTEETVTVQ